MERIKYVIMKAYTIYKYGFLCVCMCTYVPAGIGFFSSCRVGSRDTTQVARLRETPLPIKIPHPLKAHDI